MEMIYCFDFIFYQVHIQFVFKLSFVKYMMDVSKTHKKLTKTAVFAAFDTILVFLFTWLWFYMTHDTLFDKISHSTQSFWYTIYISLLFAIYYFLFEMGWKAFKNGTGIE